jgi:Druantia protein DruA/DDE_Tnp_1-associated
MWPETIAMTLNDLRVRPIHRAEEPRYQQLMQTHHYLGALPKIGETRWYVATWREEWVALLSFSAAAWKCAARDRWIGWPFRHQYARLPLLANNSRFLILPAWHRPNLASRTLALCQRRLSADWQTRFGHPLLLLETFVDPTRFQGTLYKATNWIYVGDTKGFRRTSHGYSATAHSPKMVFVYPLHAKARALLSRPVLAPPYRHGGLPIMLTADQMRFLPTFFATIPDPRRAQGRRHPLPTVLALAAGATLCGMRGYKAMADWASSLGSKARTRFGCRLVNGHRVVPSEYVIRDVLIRIDPDHLDRALQRWQAIHGTSDDSLAIDGKVMCNAIDDQGHQTHIMSVVGHQTKSCYTQKKSALCR